MIQLAKVKDVYALMKATGLTINEIYNYRVPIVLLNHNDAYRWISIWIYLCDRPYKKSMCEFIELLINLQELDLVTPHSFLSFDHIKEYIHHKNISSLFSEMVFST
jgi:hypothetical protein